MTDSITNDIYSQEHFYKAFKVIACASHWRDEKGQLHKLTANLKAIYHHRLDQYNSYHLKGFAYYETNKQVSNCTGISTKTIEKINPVLKSMGLLEFNRVGGLKGEHKYSVQVNTINKIIGQLVNPKLIASDSGYTGKDHTPEEWANYQINKNKLDLLQAEVDDIKSNMFNKPKHSVSFSLSTL